MSASHSLPLPQSTCAYDRYDPITLQPLNDETYVRLQELGWCASDFSGQSVLDIGCNSGLLTMHSLRLGASKVNACDVQQPFVDFVASVVQAKQLPVTVNRLAFDKLTPAENGGDIVLFMEVLHWAVSQGMELRDVVRRLAQLTGKILYIEFPWSVAEPSIQKQTKLTAETYSADAVLDELTRYFKSVRVVRFMRYFGFDSRSQRVLLEAREKRPEASILEQLPEAYSLDVALSRGRNESYLLTSPGGALVAKLLAPENRLARLPETLCNRLFDELNEGRPKTIVAPEKRKDSYLLAAAEGRSWMLFPFVGPLPSAGKARTFPIDFDRLLELFINVRRDLRGVSPALLTSLREQAFFTPWRAVISTDAMWAAAEGALQPIKEAALDLLAEATGSSDENLDALCHGDLQTGNFVFDRSNQAMVIDLDNLGLGTIYSDGLLGFIWRGAAEETLAKFCEQLQKEEKRAVARFDVAFAVANGLAWYSTVRAANPAALKSDQVERLHKGLEAALDFARSCAM
jgi:SAM-dependent methyltransferase